MKYGNIVLQQYTPYIAVGWRAIGCGVLIGSSYLADRGGPDRKVSVSVHFYSLGERSIRAITNDEPKGFADD